MNPEIVYALAGALAAFLRALAAEQDTVSRKTLIDVILGGVSGVLVPTFVIQMQPEWSILVRSAIVLSAGYLTGSLLSIIASKVPGLGLLRLDGAEAAKEAREVVAAEIQAEGKK